MTEKVTRDSNGTILRNGDSVKLIKDLEFKATAAILKRGTLIKNIRLTHNEEEIECNAKVKGLLKTCFLEKHAPPPNNWSETDSAHCIALHHEFLRCQDAFLDFERLGTSMIMAGNDRITAYKTYNAYSRFILHLYEFLIGATKREIGLSLLKLDNNKMHQFTKDIKGEDADRFISNETQRVLTGRRNTILRGYAPEWENDISYYPEKVPTDFASKFRLFRNKASVHVGHERPDMALTDFYKEYHKYLYMLYYNNLSFWGMHSDRAFPDLKEITDFSLSVGVEKKK